MTYTGLRARYSKGTLKLSEPLQLPEGAEVQVSVTTADRARKKRRASRRRYRHPTRTFSWSQLRRLSGMAALGGDALADSEAIGVRQPLLYRQRWSGLSSNPSFLTACWPKRSA